MDSWWEGGRPHQQASRLWPSTARLCCVQHGKHHLCQGLCMLLSVQVWCRVISVAGGKKFLLCVRKLMLKLFEGTECGYPPLNRGTSLACNRVPLSPGITIYHSRLLRRVLGEVLHARFRNKYVHPWQAINNKPMTNCIKALATRPHPTSVIMIEVISADYMHVLTYMHDVKPNGAIISSSKFDAARYGSAEYSKGKNIRTVSRNHTAEEDARCP